MWSLVAQVFLHGALIEHRNRQWLFANDAIWL